MSGGDPHQGPRVLPPPSRPGDRVVPGDEGAGAVEPERHLAPVEGDGPDCQASRHDPVQYPEDPCLRYYSPGTRPGHGVAESRPYRGGPGQQRRQHVRVRAATQPFPLPDGDPEDRRVDRLRGHQQDVTVPPAGPAQDQHGTARRRRQRVGQRRVRRPGAVVLAAPPSAQVGEDVHEPGGQRIHPQVAERLGGKPESGGLQHRHSSGEEPAARRSANSKKARRVGP
jgi:hypothetical protein